MAVKTEQDYKTEMLGCLRLQLPPNGAEALSFVHPEIIAQIYCCGLRFPDMLDGLRVLSLGCGFVRDCYVLSKLIGPKGQVVGVDPSDHVVSFGEKFLDYHREATSFSKNNLRFKTCEPDELLEAGLEKEYFDLICFNTVLGLTPKKREIMGQLSSVLKTGGEVFFTEMVANCRVRDEVKEVNSLWAEGLAGAFYCDDLVTMAREFGFSTPRLVQSIGMRIKEKDLQEFIGNVKYSMATYRMFKLPAEQSKNSQVLVYTKPLQGIMGETDVIDFDSRNKFKNGLPVSVDCELATILRTSRFSSVFEVVTGNKDYEVIKKNVVIPSHKLQGTTLHQFDHAQTD